MVLILEKAGMTVSLEAGTLGGYKAALCVLRAKRAWSIALSVNGMKGIRAFDFRPPRFPASQLHAFRCVACCGLRELQGTRLTAHGARR